MRTLVFSLALCALLVLSATMPASARERIAIYDEAILPQTKDTMNAALGDYRAGKGEFLDVIDAWRQVLLQELERDRVLVDLEQAMADLERATGSHVPTIPIDPSPKPKE